jgi:DNA-binding PadR family transcriptional regulator
MVSSKLFKGFFKSVVLKLLKDEGPMYGYQIIGKVKLLTNNKLSISYGALYPILHKLKKEGALITASEHKNNRLRIYYALTPKGHSLCAAKLKELHEFSESLQMIVKHKPDLNHD